MNTYLSRFDAMADKAAAQVIAQYSTSFSLAVRTLPKPERTHIRNLYAVVRIADEIVDGTTAQAIRDFTASFSVPATREEVYRAITKPNSWWDQKAEGNASEKGGEFHVEDRDFSVREADDGKRVVWNVEPTDDNDHEWDDTSLIFDISEDDDGETKVNFTHRGIRPHDRGYDEIAKTWKDRIAKGLQPLINRAENS